MSLSIYTAHSGGVLQTDGNAFTRYGDLPPLRRRGSYGLTAVQCRRAAEMDRAENAHAHVVPNPHDGPRNKCQKQRTIE